MTRETDVATTLMMKLFFIQVRNSVLARR